MSDHHRAASAEERVTLPSSTDQLVKLRAALRRALDESAFSDDERHDIVLATHEAAVNAMTHGNGLDPAKRVVISIRVTPQTAEIEVVDEGDGFDWQAATQRVREGRIPADAVAGRGLMVMLRMMDAMQYSTSGNTVRLRKRASEESSQVE